MHVCTHAWQHECVGAPRQHSASAACGPAPFCPAAALLTAPPRLPSPDLTSNPTPNLQTLLATLVVSSLSHVASAAKMVYGDDAAAKPKATGAARRTPKSTWMGPYLSWCKACAANKERDSADTAAGPAPKTPRCTSPLGFWAWLTNPKAAAAPPPPCTKMPNASAPTAPLKSRVLSFLSFSRRSHQAANTTANAYASATPEATVDASAARDNPKASTAAKVAAGFKRLFSSSKPSAAAHGTAAAAAAPLLALTLAIFKAWLSGNKKAPAAVATATATANVTTISSASSGAITVEVTSANPAEADTPASDAPCSGSSTDGDSLSSDTAAEATCIVEVSLASAAPLSAASPKLLEATPSTPSIAKGFKWLPKRKAKAAAPTAAAAAAAAAAAPAPQAPSKLELFALRWREGGARALARISSRGASPDQQRALGEGAAVSAA